MDKTTSQQHIPVPAHAIQNTHLPAHLLRSYLRLYAAARVHGYTHTAPLDITHGLVPLLGIHRSQVYKNLRALRLAGLLDWTIGVDNRYTIHFPAAAQDEGSSMARAGSPRQDGSPAKGDGEPFQTADPGWETPPGCPSPGPAAANTPFTAGAPAGAGGSARRVPADAKDAAVAVEDTVFAEKDMATATDPAALHAGVAAKGAPVAGKDSVAAKNAAVAAKNAAVAAKNASAAALQATGAAKDTAAARDAVVVGVDRILIKPDSLHHQQQTGGAEADSFGEDETQREVLRCLARCGVWLEPARRIAALIAQNEQRPHNPYLPNLGDVLGWIAYAFADQHTNRVERPASLLAANLLSNRRCPENYRPARVCARCHHPEGACDCPEGPAYHYPPKYLDFAFTRDFDSEVETFWGICLTCRAYPCQCEFDDCEGEE